MILINNYTLINPRKNNDISLYLGLFSKSPTVLREAIFTTPYSGLSTYIEDVSAEVGAGAFGYLTPCVLVVT